MLSFLLSTVAISLSGVMAPGPITAATLAAGARSRHAGALVALGHAVVEFPLIGLLVLGMGQFLESSAAKAAIDLAGGAVLALMGVQLLRSLRHAAAGQAASAERHSVMIGIVLTGTNPYFFVWWTAAGLKFATWAAEFGVLMLALFAVVHWLCDLVWLEVLSLLGFKGSEAFGPRAARVVTAVCGTVLLGFGAKFLYDAVVEIVPHAGRLMS